MRTFVKSVALALALAFCAGTQAVAMTTNLGSGVLSPGDNGTFSNNYPLSPDTFSDEYRFSVTVPSTITANVFNFYVDEPYLQWDLEEFKFYFDISPDSGTSWNPPTSMSQIVNSGGIGTYSLSLFYSDLVPGTLYRLRIEGITHGSNGGAYFGNYKIAAVPLPPAVVLFGLGLVAVFGISRRMKTT